MQRKRQPPPSRDIVARAKQVLAFAAKRRETAHDWVELHNAVFGIKGKATELFQTEAERRAFTRTAECRRVHALMDGLPKPPVKKLGVIHIDANGSTRPARKRANGKEA